MMVMLASVPAFIAAQTKPKTDAEAKPQGPKSVEELPDYAELKKKLDLKDVVTVAEARISRRKESLFIQSLRKHADY